MTLPDSPWGTLSEVSRTSRAFSPKMARSRRSSGVCSVSPLGVTLPTSTSPAPDLGPDADDAALVEVGQDLLGEVGDVPGDLLGAELGVAGVDLVLLDVDRGEHVVAHEALGQDDGVLEVVALPRHEGDEEVLARAPARRCGWPSRRPARRWPTTCWPSSTITFWLIEVFWLERRNLASGSGAGRARGPSRSRWPGRYSTTMWSPDDLGHGAVALGQQHVAGVLGGARLDAGADVGRLGHHQRHGLLLHVGAHQGPVGVVVLDEGDQRRGHRHDLLRRDVHEVDLGRRDVVDLAGGAVGGRGGAHPHAGTLGPAPHQHALVDEAAPLVELGVGLGDDVLLLLVGGEVDDLVADAPVDHLAVRASR